MARESLLAEWKFLMRFRKEQQRWDMALTIIGGKIPAAQMFATVPFGMTAQEMNGWLHYGGGLELWRELQTLRYCAVHNRKFCVQMGGWFNKEILSVDDLQGLKMRIPGLVVRFWLALEGRPSNCL